MKFPMDSLRTVEPNNKENLIKFFSSAGGYFREVYIHQKQKKEKKIS